MPYCAGRSRRRRTIVSGVRRAPLQAPRPFYLQGGPQGLQKFDISGCVSARIEFEMLERFDSTNPPEAFVGDSASPHEKPLQSRQLCNLGHDPIVNLLRSEDDGSYRVDV